LVAGAVPPAGWRSSGRGMPPLVPGPSGTIKSSRAKATSSQLQYMCQYE
jgi:hypothetical protein